MLEENLDISYAKRDKLMVQVIAYLIEQNPNDKIIFIAHNGHVQSGSTNWMPKQAGSYLRDKFGKEYYNIRMTFYDGEYRARERTTVDNPYPISATFSHSAVPWTSEYLFNSINKSPFFLPLRDLKSINGKNDWIFKSLEHLGIGANHKEYGYDTFKLREGFDAVVFIKTSKAR